MAKHKKTASLNGEVYMLRIELDGRSIIKIGTTNRCALKRMLEIAEVIHGTYKFIPKMEIIINEKTQNNYAVEAALLERLKEYKYTPAFEFEGCSELIECDLAVAIGVYRDCIDADYPAAEPNLIEI